MTNTPSSLAAELLAVAERLAREAGDMALAGRRRGLQNVSTKTSRTDMVTDGVERRNLFANELAAFFQNLVDQVGVDF